MDFVIKFTIGLFVFSVMLLFFKSTKKLSENYYEKSLLINDVNREKKQTDSIDPNSIRFRIRKLEN